MAKTMIRNTIADKTHTFYLPADTAASKAFCDAVLEGTYALFEEKSVTGNPVEQVVNLVTVTGQSADKRKLTFSFYAKQNLSEDEIRQALINKTYNSIKFDEVIIIGMQRIEVTAPVGP